MTRVSLWIALLCVPLFALVMIAFRVQPPNTAPESEIGRCATPCWNGIEPGITTRETALTALTALKGFKPIKPECYSPSMQPCELYHWLSPENIRIWTGIVTQRGVVISVDDKAPGFTLGEALLSLENLHHGLYSFQLGHDRNWLYIWLSFSDARISISAQSSCPNSFYTILQAPIDVIAIQSPIQNRQHEPMTFGLLRSMIYDLCET